MASRQKIIGHEKQISIIAKSIKLSRIYPFWIFFGIDGIGKSLVARNFAKCLLSDKTEFDENLNLPTYDRIHNLVNNKIHPDFFEIDNPAISTDEMRNWVEKVRKTSALSQRKVVIIKHAENLNKNVCNSLLKILEEPPKDSVFILICSNIGRFPTTLISRAIKLHFNPLADNEVQSVLDSFEIKIATELVEISAGSVGDALYLYENNGIDLYKNIKSSFSSNYENSHKLTKFLIESNLCNENFRLLKKLFIKALKAYLDTITQTKIDSVFEKFVGTVSVDYEAEKILKIISNMNRWESLQLDKGAILAGSFETFFERSAA